MKKILLAVAVALCATTAMAEGYQVNSLSARQGGMAHTGVAQKLGAESMYFNPAGLAFMNSTVDVTGSFNAVFSSVTATIDGNQYKTDSDPSTPLMFNAAFRIFDNFKAGVSFYTPYGSGINWGIDWPGALLNQKVKLQAFTVQPTFSYRILPNLAIGAGLNIAWGNVNLNKGLVNPSSLDMLLAAQGVPYTFGQTIPASINLTGTSDIAWGFNVGAMWDITKQITVGANFRSKMKLAVNKSGTVTVNYANEIARTSLQESLDLLNSANFAAEMPMPYVFSFGVSYKPIQRLIIAFDAQLTGWNAYKELNIDFLDPKAQPFNQDITKAYKNSWCYRLGAQFALTKRFDVRAGLIVDTAPVNKEYYNPETPGMTRIEPSVGLSFRPVKSFSIDLSFLYVAGAGAKGTSCSYPDFLAAKINAMMGQPVLPAAPTIHADYKLHAVIPSIGVSYSF